MIKHCTQCGKPVVHAIPQGDTHLRFICPSCQYIHYENPRLILGCVAEFDQRILLCKRAIEPRHGFWTLPAGFMENGESTQEGAARESFEEACAKIEINALFAIISIPHINQVHLFYRGKLHTPNFAAGEESLEVDLFEESRIPWSDLAFSSVRYCLERYLEDRKRGSFALHETSF